MTFREANMTFDEWMKDVNFWTLHIAGLDVNDLPDCCFRDWYDDGVKPQTAARRAINNASK